MPISHYPEHVLACNVDTAAQRLSFAAFRAFLKGETPRRRPADID